MRQYKNTEEKGIVESFPVAIVISLFNPSVAMPLLDGAIEHLRKRGFKEEHITVVETPGALDIPIFARMLAAENKYEAIIALGSIIHGETYHYTWVGPQVCKDCQDISRDFDIPVIFGVLTTEHASQAMEALGGRYGHKGVNCVDYAVAITNVRRQLASSQ
ncbi:riboflavin synthase beta chain (6,7-dimethyl-8-ribityllumazine synthase) [Legionella birminghamensis]|uniref:6,7-dimethyl-8-ribityllumazine synthase n=1 Tax=Legionella birminghamensis TaxID=28083 RepID=A0A378IA19_9GAMM|nr:6,7-dimethyl-8-ribityllumazine synthase [Legionella birminghamensis]KTC69362.1 riboflavin synthase beta chain (6,7-dimethyl-8-ribityllumazine synthase) [Legionella birminghamensis]STX31625.1 riboflavin synthase subunit beta [Legionella birminghamensis]